MRNLFVKARNLATVVVYHVVANVPRPTGRQLLGLLFVFGLIFGYGTESYAQTSRPSCDLIAGTDTDDHTMPNAIKCVLEVFAPNALIVSVSLAVLAIMLLLWGVRGGFAICAKVAYGMIRTVTGRM